MENVKKMARKTKRWMQKAFRPERKGRLHRQLGIPLGRKIPLTLLEKIKRTPVGRRIRNPTKTGRRRITVTRLLKRRAVLAHTARTAGRR